MERKAYLVCVGSNPVKKENSMATKQNEETKGTITIPAEDWKHYKALTSERNALNNKVKELEATFPLPESIKANVGKWIVVDGNGDVQGKLTIFPVDAFIVDEHCKKRLS